MGDLRAVPELLARSDRSFARTQRRMRTIKFWILGISGCIYIGSLVFYAVRFVDVWHGGDWLSYWAALMSAGPGGMAFARIALWRDSRADLFAPVAELRQAIRDRDERLAPLAVSALVGELDISANPNRIGPLRRPAARGPVATLWCVGVLALLVPCIGAPLALGAGNEYLTLLLAVTGLPLGLICILLGYRLISPLFVRIEPDGLRWRRPLGLTAFVAWRDAKSFFSLSSAPPSASARETLYVLDCGAVTFAWRARTSARSDASPHWPSLKLRQIITERTGLPLHDVTAQARRIAWGPLAEVPQTLRGARRMLLASAYHSTGESIGHRFRVAGMALSPFLTLVLISLVAMLAQAPYYERLYTQTHSHAALYRAALTHADGDWPNYGLSHFTDGVYHFQQSENYSYLTYIAAPHRYDHVLVEVSGRTGGPFKLGGVGFAILGPDSATRLLTFRVTPDGSWWIERILSSEAYENNKFYRIGDMSAIHQGFGVANQIAVLMNGSDFIFYVNGHFAAGYHDDALKNGQVCLYLDVTSDSGDFSDFAVYPL